MNPGHLHWKHQEVPIELQGSWPCYALFMLLLISMDGTLPPQTPYSIWKTNILVSFHQFCIALENVREDRSNFFNPQS